MQGKAWKSITAVAAGAALALAGAGASADAEQAVGVVDGGKVLVTFDTVAPGTLTSAKPITGLQPGEHIAGVDFRHLPAQLAPIPPSRLFALGVVTGATDRLRLYTIDAGTGAATLLTATSIVATTSAAYGMDFNPTADRVRVVNADDQNLRLNPNNGTLSATDTALNPAGRQVAALAYDRVSIPQPPIVAGNTTAYGISVATNQLVTVGGINSSPSPNGGTVNAVGPLGVTLSAADAASVNLDVAFAGTAFMTGTPSGGDASLYTVNLQTGAATLVGTLATPLAGFATVPGATVQVDPATVTQTESGAATVTVTRTGSLAHTTTVQYATGDGTATSADYRPVSGTLTFAPDEATKTISVPIVEDTVDEPDETFAVTLSAPSALSALGAATAATVTIADDDPAPAIPPPPDTAAPSVTISGVKSSMSLTSFLKGLKVTLTPSEPAAFSVELQGTVTSARISSYNLPLATKTLKLAAGAQKLTLKPSKKLVGTPRKTVKVRLRVTATDASGNQKVVTKTIKVTPRRR